MDKLVSRWADKETRIDNLSLLLSFTKGLDSPIKTYMFLNNGRKMKYLVRSYINSDRTGRLHSTKSMCVD